MARHAGGRQKQQAQQKPQPPQPTLTLALLQEELYLGAVYINM